MHKCHQMVAKGTGGNDRMGKRIAAGMFAVLMLFMVAAPMAAVRADGVGNVSPREAAWIRTEMENWDTLK